MTCYDLDIYQGDDWGATVTVLNEDGTTANLTGYTAQAQIRTGPADQSKYVMAEMTCAVALPNTVSLSLTHAQTLGLQDFFYVWDLQLITNQNMTVTIIRGQVNVTAEVTREGDPLWQPPAPVPALTSLHSSTLAFRSQAPSVQPVRSVLPGLPGFKVRSVRLGR
jgi:hypothetical protein